MLSSPGVSEHTPVAASWQTALLIPAQLCESRSKWRLAWWPEAGPGRWRRHAPAPWPGVGPAEPRLSVDERGLEAELGGSGGGGAGEVSPTEGWSFRNWVPADGREGLQSCSRGAASSAHQSPFVPSLSGSWKGRRGSPSSTAWGCDWGWGQGPVAGTAEVGVLGSVFLRHVVSTQGVERCLTSSLISSCPGAQIL